MVLRVLEVAAEGRKDSYDMVGMVGIEHWVGSWL